MQEYAPPTERKEATESRLGLDIPVELQLLDGERERVGATIRRVNSGFFQLRSPNNLQEERKLELLYEGRKIQAEVVYSRKRDSGFHYIGIRTLMGNHGTVRKELRLPVDMRATIQIPGQSKPIRARVIDISPSGLGMNLPCEIPPGTMAALDLGHGIAFGEIRHCKVLSKYRYRAGFWLEEFIRRPASKTPALALTASLGNFLDVMGGFAYRVREFFSKKRSREFDQMEPLTGIEPVTSSLPRTRSTN